MGRASWITVNNASCPRHVHGCPEAEAAPPDEHDDLDHKAHLCLHGRVKNRRDRLPVAFCDSYLSQFTITAACHAVPNKFLVQAHYHIPTAQPFIRPSRSSMIAISA